MVVAALMLSHAAFVACTDDELEAADALFRPILSSDEDMLIVTGTSVTVYWNLYESADTYDVGILKRDSKTGDVDTLVSASTTEDNYSYDGLSYDTTYEFFIRCRSTESGLTSKYSYLEFTTDDITTKLKAISSANVTDVQARITWSEGAEFTECRIFDSKEDTLIATYTITSAELEACEKVISNLEPKTTYYVRVYIGDEYAGKKTFTTQASEDYGDVIVVDLRGVELDEETLAYYNEYYPDSVEIALQAKRDGFLKTSYITSLIEEYPDQDITLVFEGGYEYTMNTMQFPSTTGRIKFTTGLSISGYAQFNVSGNITMDAAAEVGAIEFEKINFSDCESKLRSSSNFGGTYLMNCGNAGATLGEFKLSTCEVRYKRGLFRYQAACTLGNYIIDNCIVDSIGGYGILSMDSDGAVVENITLSNSTFSHCAVFVVATKNTTTPIENISMTNCTAAYLQNSTSRYWFNLALATNTPIVMKYNIFGEMGKCDGSVTANYGAVCYTTVSAGNFSLEKNYYTNDDNTGDGAYWKDASTSGFADEEDFVQLSYTTDELFADPVNGDFSFNSSTVKGYGAGDPRWLE